MQTFIDHLQINWKKSPKIFIQIAPIGIDEEDSYRDPRKKPGTFKNRGREEN